MYTVFQNTLIATFFGIVWGTLMFSLNRFIVMSVTQDGSRRVAIFLVRLVLAVLIATVVIYPLEMRLFATDIENHLDKKKTEEIAEVEQAAERKEKEYRRSYAKEEKVRRESYGVSMLDEDVKARRRQLEICWKEFDKLRDEHLKECAGEAGTMKRGDGPECKRTFRALIDQKYKCQTLDNQIARKQAEIDTTLTEYREEINEWNDKKSRELDDIIEDKRKKIQKIEERRLGSFLIRFQALSEISDESKAAKYTIYIITLVFAIFECSPILVQLLLSRGGCKGKLRKDRKNSDIIIYEEKSTGEQENYDRTIPSFLLKDEAIRERINSEIEKWKKDDLSLSDLEEKLGRLQDENSSSSPMKVNKVLLYFLYSLYSLVFVAFIALSVIAIFIAILGETKIDSMVNSIISSTIWSLDKQLPGAVSSEAT